MNERHEDSLRASPAAGEEVVMEPLAAWAAALGWSLNRTQLAQFARYQALLLEWNERINLTAIRLPAEIQRRHFLDSLTCALVTGDLDGSRLIDVGTGAGFPGLPLKILYPRMALTLVESVGKKAQFLEAVVAGLELEGVEVVVGRAETIGRLPRYREQYHWALARGVARLPLLLEYLLPLCRLGGCALAQKGEGAAEELAQAGRAIELLGGGAARLVPVNLPAGEQPHYLVQVQKQRATPDRYPRRPGMPAKRPL